MQTTDPVKPWSRVIVVAGCAWIIETVAFKQQGQTGRGYSIETAQTHFQAQFAKSQARLAIVHARKLLMEAQRLKTRYTTLLKGHLNAGDMAAAKEVLQTMNQASGKTLGVLGVFRVTLFGDTMVPQ